MLNQQKNYLKDCEYYRNLIEEEKLKKEIMLTLDIKVNQMQKERGKKNKKEIIVT